MYIHANIAMNSLINIIHILISVIISLYSYIQLYIYNTLYPTSSHPYYILTTMCMYKYIIYYCKIYIMITIHLICILNHAYIFQLSESNELVLGLSPAGTGLP